MSEFAVSVIVPVYNTEIYLKQCLDSIVGQTLANIEIICVYQQSIDNSWETLKWYAANDSRIIVMTEPKADAAGARNAGASAARGEYVAFVDSDDWIKKDFLQTLYRLAKDRDADIAGGDVVYWHSANESHRGWVNEWAFSNGLGVITHPKDRKGVIYSCACWYKIYRRDFLKMFSIAFPDGFVFGEDVVYTFKAAVCANKIVLTDNTTYYYRQRPDSAMATSRNHRGVFDVIKSYSICFDFLDTLDIEQEHKRIYRLICEDFALYNLNSWLMNRPRKDRQEYYDQFKKLVNHFYSPSANPFLGSVSIAIYNTITRNSSVKKYVRKMNITLKHSTRRKIYMFNVSLITIEEGMNKIWYYLFGGIPLYKIKKDTDANRHYLFGFIPLIKSRWIYA